MGMKYGLAHHSAQVHRVQRDVRNAFYALFRTTNQRVGGFQRIGANPITVRRPFRIRRQLNLHLFRQQLIESQGYLGRQCAIEANAGRQIYAGRTNVKSALARYRVGQIQNNSQVVKIIARQPPGRAANLQPHVVRQVGADLQIFGYVFEFNGHREGRRQFGFARDGNPKRHRSPERKQLPAEVSEDVPEDELHGRSKLCWRTAAELWDRAVDVRRSRRSRRPVSSCSTRSGSTSSSISANAAIEILPVSSDTTTEKQSDSSVIPNAARWRVPSSVISRGLVVKGRKQAAEAIRSPWMITAPSCSAAPGWKMAHSRSREIAASRFTPLSTNVRRPIFRSTTISAPIFFCAKWVMASKISWLTSRRSNWLMPRNGLRPSRASIRRSSDWNITIRAIAVKGASVARMVRSTSNLANTARP